MAGRVRWAGRRWRGRASVAGEFVDVMPLVVVEAQGAGQGGEDGGGGADAALFEAGVVVHADRGELGDLLAAQSRDPARGVRLRQAALPRIQLRPTGPEKGTGRPGVGA